MNVIDIDNDEHGWFDLLPAGSDQVTRMASLWKDDERGFRAVLVDFPDDWRRDAVGNQPAQEEMVSLTGAMYINGLRAGVGQLLVGVPHGTRSDTYNDADTRVLVWFSGVPGGWQDGPHDPPRDMRVVDIAPGVIRPPAEGMVGSIEVHENVAGMTFDVDVDLLWLHERKFVHLAPGEVAPDAGGLCVVKRWA